MERDIFHSILLLLSLFQLRKGLDKTVLFILAYSIIGLVVDVLDRTIITSNLELVTVSLSLIFTLLLQLLATEVKRKWVFYIANGIFLLIALLIFTTEFHPAFWKHGVIYYSDYKLIDTHEFIIFKTSIYLIGFLVLFYGLYHLIFNYERRDSLKVMVCFSFIVYTGGSLVFEFLHNYLIQDVDNFLATMRVLYATIFSISSLILAFGLITWKR